MELKKQLKCKILHQLIIFLASPDKDLRISPNKKVILSINEIYKSLAKFNLPIYAADRKFFTKVHFMDCWIRISHNAICDKYNIDYMVIDQEVAKISIT